MVKTIITVFFVLPVPLQKGHLITARNVIVPVKDEEN